MFFSSILVFCTDKRNSAVGDEKEKFKLFFDHNQLIGRNVEKYEREMLTPLLNKKRNIIYQGMNVNHKTF